MKSGIHFDSCQKCIWCLCGRHFFCAEHLRHYGSLVHQLGPRPPNQLQLTAMLHHNMILMVTMSLHACLVANEYTYYITDTFLSNLGTTEQFILAHTSIIFGIDFQCWCCWCFAKWLLNQILQFISWKVCLQICMYEVAEFLSLSI